MSILKKRDGATIGIANPKYLCEFRFRANDDSFVISYERPIPNWWWRMWQYLFFGFEWRKTK